MTNATDDFFNEGTSPGSASSGNSAIPDSMPLSAPAPAPAKERTASGRLVRRRARKACVECHNRKVRCDVLTRPGQVCTNCRLDGHPCNMRTKDGRRRQQDPSPSNESPDEVPVHSFSQLSPVNSTPPTTTTTASHNHTHNPLQFGASIHRRKPENSRYDSWSAVPSRLATCSEPIPCSPSSNPDVLFSYYDFLETEPLSHIPPEDFKFLEHKGCFHLPVRQVLDAFVREYFLHMHPALPILNERHFWEVYLSDSPSRAPTKKLNLFLIRAIMFASCSFVDTTTIELLGFQSPYEARIALYRQAKLLFDFGATSDPIAISQGALLLTYYCSGREPVANTQWLRVAIQYANLENAHLYYRTPDLTSKELDTKKRLWWCCILRDRILHLGLRRSIQITHNEFDFSQPPLSIDDLEGEFNCSQVYESHTKLVLAKILIAQIDLAIILTDVLGVIYPISQLDYNTLMKMPGEIRKSREGLDEWASESQAASLKLGSPSTMHKSVSLFEGLTQIYYHSARAALCQYESFSLEALTPAGNPVRTRELGSELHSSIANISKIVGELVSLDVARYFPISVVAFMALPIILNSIDLQSSSNTTFKNEPKRIQLRLYNEAMEICHTRYTGTDRAIQYINKAIAAAASDMTSHSLEAGPDGRFLTSGTTSTALLRAAANKIEDWFETFVSRPKEYLRIALSIDISLCIGRYPDHNDLPRLLLAGYGNSTSLVNIPRNLTPKLNNIEAAVELAELELAARGKGETTNGDRRTDLDFFDLNALDGMGSCGEGDWSEVTIEDILSSALQQESAEYTSSQSLVNVGSPNI